MFFWSFWKRIIKTNLMKKNFFTLLLAAVLISSCSSDDGESDGSSIVGTWDAIEVNLGESVDWNDDGTASENLMDEIDCFAATATFTADGEYSSATTQINFDITEEGYTITCGGPVPASGTYSTEGNTLRITDDEDDESRESTYSISGNTLTVTGYVEAVDGIATLVMTRRE